MTTQNDPSPLVVLTVVGLTERLLAHAPRLRALANEGALLTLAPPLPAVTCTSQATIITGCLPREHGIVGNGWYFRDLSEVWFWRQSHRLVQGERLWQAARKVRPGLRTAQLFWWYNMYADVELSVTPRPHYPADGRKIPGIYTEPPELERELQERLGPFPLFHFWGPRTSIASSRWIADATRVVFDRDRPDLLLSYLPHLDYDLQRLGPAHDQIPGAVAEVDAVAGALIEHVRARGARVVVLSEYGVEPVEIPVHLNRVLREAGLLRVRDSAVVGETLDAGASRAFAVADHQVAHVYVRDAADVRTTRALLDKIPGVSRVLGREEQGAEGLDHPRSGELVVLASPGCWFTYYYWLDDARAPDFARTVDIHRKPGYDPVELFLAPGLRTRARLVRRLAQKALGMRYLMDVIPLDSSLVRGSHGRKPSTAEEAPLLITTGDPGASSGPLPMTEVKALLLRLLT